jgi:nucleoside-diphosphate-sugar epimerase
VLSLGPLDAFAAWYAMHAPRSAAVVALGSTGVHDKRHSPDAEERALAARLAQAEAALAEAVKRRGSRLVLLRPGLLWGPGTQAFAPLIGIARRYGMLPLPRGATGLRQPVHVDDVAAAVLAAVEGDFAGDFDLPGGETLAWNAMVRRALAAEAPGTRVMAISDSLLALGLAMARAAGRGRVLAGVPLARLRRDQVHDGAPAAAAWGWAPRRYLPGSGDHTQEHCLSVTNN